MYKHVPTNTTYLKIKYTDGHLDTIMHIQLDERKITIKGSRYGKEYKEKKQRRKTKSNKRSN